MFQKLKQYFCEHKEKKGWYMSYHVQGHTLYARYCEKCEKKLSFSQMQYGLEHTYRFGYEADQMLERLGRYAESKKPKLLEYKPNEN